MRRLLTIAAFAAALSSAAAATPQAAAPTDDPRAYLDRALSELETKHINRAKADWPKLRAEARKLAADAQTPADTYKAIDHVIEALGEKHTRLYAAPKKQPQPAASSAPAPAPKPYKMPEPTGELIDGRYGYIAIPQFGAGADHFGQTTADYVTVNNPVTLSDGARIQMTVGYTRNRDGSLQTGPIQPDEPTTSEAAREAALRWLSSQKCEKGAGA